MSLTWKRRVGAPAVGGALVLLALAGCHDGSSPLHVSSAPADGTSAGAPRTPTAPSSAAAGAATANALLATLAVKGRAPKTGYARAQFGAAWSDDNDDPLGRNGCDTRNDVLRRDLTGETLKPDTRGCVVLTGSLRDPYTGRTIPFHRGERTSAAVQIDHVVALSDAWQTGAQLLDPRTRTDLANDPLELLAVDGATNEAKRDGNAATWLPPNKSYRCAYVARQVAVKARYHLWVTAPEHDAAARVLARCPGQRAPREAGHAHIARARPTQGASAPAHTAPAHDVYYRTCADARAAGVTPLHRGDPGYDAHLDRDGDGTACE